MKITPNCKNIAIQSYFYPQLIVEVKQIVEVKGCKPITESSAAVKQIGARMKLKQKISPWLLLIVRNYLLLVGC